MPTISSFNSLVYSLEIDALLSKSRGKYTRNGELGDEAYISTSSEVAVRRPLGPPPAELGHPHSSLGAEWQSPFIR